MLVRRTRLAPARAAARDPARGRKRWVDFGWTANFGREDIGGSAALSRQLRDNPRIGSSPRSFQSTHERSLSAESLQQHARIHGNRYYDRQLAQPFHDRARPRNRKSLRLASSPRRVFDRDEGAGSEGRGAGSQRARCWVLDARLRAVRWSSARILEHIPHNGGQWCKIPNFAPCALAARLEFPRNWRGAGDKIQVFLLRTTRKWRQNNAGCRMPDSGC